MRKRLGQQVVAAAALVMGTAIGVLTVGLGVALVGAPWEFHFAAQHVAAAAVAFVGLTVVATGVVIVIDLIDGGSGLRDRR